MGAILRQLVAVLLLSYSVCAQSLTTPQVVRKALPAVVKIETSESRGSGVIINLEGYIITNNHVIEDAHGDVEQITVITASKRVYRVASIVAVNKSLDLAVLKVSALKDESAIVIADKDSILLGEDAIAIGSPLGKQSYVTKGIVSRNMTPYIYTTASINPGNSGGALLNDRAQLIGIPTEKLTYVPDTLIPVDGMGKALSVESIIYFLRSNKIKYNL